MFNYPCHVAYLHACAQLVCLFIFFESTVPNVLCMFMFCLYIKIIQWIFYVL